ncbi:CPBP family intramembrane glutamic endopeptidase [Corynebacterium sp. H127]|uniref:CPBP family intramembrane glutamic endopeptidase n=1 Tax=Corynebacterium sp. H127 TaxID=3133418 RepID=UPI00309C17EA
MTTWKTKHPILVGIGIAILGTLLTAVGSAVGQVMQLDDATVIYVLVGFISLSALLGVLWMKVSKHSLAEYGFRTPVGWAVGLPLFILPVLNLVEGVHIGASLVVPYLLFTLTVAFNEEIWFRGLLLAALRIRGEKFAIVVSGVLFGVLHLSNAFSGRSTSSCK